MKKSNLLAAVVTLVASCFGLSAQTESIYEKGATYLENTLPPSPEPASMVKYADIPFTHSTGMAEYEVPFHVLQGRELTIPIGLKYASGGIKLDEIAGVAGLGWSLNAGGCITRTVTDMPDEFVPSAGLFRHEVPSGQLLSDLEDMVDCDEALSFLRDLVWNRIDTGLDRYNYNICGLSGSFVIQDNGVIFQLSGDGVMIDYTRDDDGAVDEFVITGPDGTVYTLSLKEMASRDGRGLEVISPMNQKLERWTAPTAWHLTSIRSRSGLETAVFSYSEAATWDRSIRSYSETLSVTCGSQQGTPVRSISSKNIESTYETRVLTGITLNGTTASFTYSPGTGTASRTTGSPVLRNFPFRLTDISVITEGNNEYLKRMEVNTGQDAYDGRIVLNGLKIYTDGALDNQWTFTYKGMEKTVSAGSQDWYGYYNGENEFSEQDNTRICPYEINLIGEGSFSLAKGSPNAEYASYMSLTSVNNDGAVTDFTYEGNVFPTLTGTYSIGVRVQKITLPGNMLKPAKVRYFTYEDPFSNGPKEPSVEMYCTVNMGFVSPGLSSDCNWQFTLHETPVTLGPSIRDSRIFYGRVTEDVTDLLFVLTEGNKPERNTARTVYEYSMADVYPFVEDCSSRFPEFCSEFYDGSYAHQLCSEHLGIQEHYNNSGPSVAPVLTRREDYAFKNGVYELVSSVEYEYDELVYNSVLVDYHAVQAYHHWLEGYMNLDHIFHFPIYAKGDQGRYPVKETRVGYHTSGNDTTVINTSYVLRNSISDPVRISTTFSTEDGVGRSMSYTYSDTWGNAPEWVAELINQRYLSEPLTQSLWILQEQQNGSSIIPISGNYKEMMTEFGWFGIGGTQHLLPSAHKEITLGTESWRETVLSRDCMGNIASFKEKGRPETVVIWGYCGRYPLAVIENSTASVVASAMGGQEVIDTLTMAEVPSSSQLAALNGLRTSLADAHITTFTHTPGKGLASVTDPAGILTSYEYTPAGRLACIKDTEGRKVSEHLYSLMSDANGRRNMRSRVFRSADSLKYSEDVRWWDVFGRKTQDIYIAASGDGRDLVTAYGSDFMMHDDISTWIPYPVSGTEGAFQTGAEDTAAEYHDTTLAYHRRHYELSARDRVTATALPGYDGHHETSYNTDVTEGFPVLRWEEGGVVLDGTYDPGSITVEKTTDADGRIVSTYMDHFGKIMGTAHGTDTPTYHIYDRFDRLRAVAGAGIRMADTLDMWRYSYDSLGRLTSKGIPGSVREHYTYDAEDRLTSVFRGGVLKEMEYDSFGRVVKVWMTRPEGQRTLLEEHTYDVYPSGVTGGNPKGKKTQSRIAVMASGSSSAGHARATWSYDAKGRPAIVKTRHADGSEQIEELEYTFSGEVASSVITYIHGNQCDELEVDYTYDIRGRLTKETATLNMIGIAPQTAEVVYGYDELGRPARRLSSVPGGKTVHSSSAYALQGWQTGLSVTLDDRLLFDQTLGYDGQETMSFYQPQYSGLISVKDESWFTEYGPAVNDREWYTYDYASRLSGEYGPSSRTAYGYDGRGNLLKTRFYNPSAITSYTYANDRLMSMTCSSPDGQDLSEFTYDALGRMTYDGLTGQSVAYNDLDLIGNVTRNGTTLVNYSYLADGTKISALDGSGEGLVYRGPFVYRTSDGGSSLTLESAAFGGGRLTPDRALFYVTDYLGSVRAVVDGTTGDLYKVSDYSTFGSDSEAPSMQTAAAPLGITLRDGYNGKEAQHPDFGTGYIDFGARQYNPALRRWMTPDPLSEKYYSISPYAFCNNNSVNYVDLDGEAVETLWDIASIGMGVRSFVKNIKSGNFRGAVGDALGVAVDAVAAAVPFVPGGVGAVRAGAKAVNAIDNVADATKTTRTISETANHVQGAAKAFNGQADTYSETASKAFRNAKDQNGVPKSQQPDRTIKPNTEAGNAAGLRDDNVVQYEFTNSKGEKVIIRQDKTTTYPDGGVQPPHYNAGKSSDNKLKQHHYYYEYNKTL